MEFVNIQKIADDTANVNNALVLMGKLAEAINTDGLKISTNELYLIATAKLSLNKVYESEAKSRTAKDPVYVQNEALRLASVAANKNQNLVNELRKFSYSLIKLQPEKFKLENNQIVYGSDLKQDLTKIYTRKLDSKQENLANAILKFKKEIEKFNVVLAEASLPKIEIKLPLTDNSGNIDLERILTVDYIGIEERKKAQIQAGIREKQARETQRIRLEKLIPKDYPNREEEILRYLAIDPDGSRYDDDFIKNLISPNKGSFVNKNKATITVYDEARIPE